MFIILAGEPYPVSFICILGEPVVFNVLSEMIFIWLMPFVNLISASQNFVNYLAQARTL